MALIVLVLVIAVSITVVRVGAMMLEFTGLDWDKAKFEALSAYTNAGFTTQESEQVMLFPLRRRIITWLIVLGNAGLVTSVGTFAGSVIRGDPLEFARTVGGVIAVTGFMVWLLRKDRVTGRLRQAVQRRMERTGMRRSAIEDILHMRAGFTLAKIELPRDAPFLGIPLDQLALRKRRIQLLAIERGTEFIAVPTLAERLQAGDRIVVYGEREFISTYFEPTAMTVPVSQTKGPAT